MKNAIHKKDFPLNALVKNGFQENSTHTQCVAEGKGVIKVCDYL